MEEVMEAATAAAEEAGNCLRKIKGEILEVVIEEAMRKSRWTKMVNVLHL